MPSGALPVMELPDWGEKVDSQKENGSVPDHLPHSVQ